MTSRTAILTGLILCIAMAGTAPGQQYRGPAGDVPPRPRKMPGPPEDPPTPSDLALNWLADHQEPDGRWDVEAYWLRSDGAATDGMGQAEYTLGVTGLAMLAFVRAGNSDAEGAHQIVVRKGAEYLRKQQDDRGCFGPRKSERFLYGHAIATEVMARLHARNPSPLHKESARRGVVFLRACQNPYRAWRYGIRPGGNDASSSGWAVSALFAAREAGIPVGVEAFDGARAWLDQITSQATGRVGYLLTGEHTVRPDSMNRRFPRHRSEALTASGLLQRIFTGADPAEDLLIGKGTVLLVNCLPKWNPKGDTTDFYYWYWGTRSMRRVGGESWEKWQAAARTAALESQRRDDRFCGSWDPADPWGLEGGRIYATATMAMVAQMLER